MIDMQGFPALDRPARPCTFQDPGIRKEFFIEGPCRLNIVLGDREGPEFFKGSGKADIPVTCGSREFRPLEQYRVLTGNERPEDLPIS